MSCCSAVANGKNELRYCPELQKMSRKMAYQTDFRLAGFVFPTIRPTSYFFTPSILLNNPLSCPYSAVETQHCVDLTRRKAPGLEKSPLFMLPVTWRA